MKCHREPVEVFESTFTFEKSSDKGFKEKAAPKEACSDGATIMERKSREGGEEARRASREDEGFGGHHATEVKAVARLMEDHQEGFFYTVPS